MTWCCGDSLGSTILSARVSGNAKVDTAANELCWSYSYRGIDLIQEGALVKEISINFMV